LPLAVIEATYSNAQSYGHEDQRRANVRGTLNSREWKSREKGNYGKRTFSQYVAECIVRK